jgi:hypothetical protein
MSNNVKPDELKSKRRNISLSDQEVYEIYQIAYPSDPTAYGDKTLSEAIRRVTNFAAILWRHKQTEK